ncbi:hypothetical protein PSTG_19784, partial [Puccinia striiformis f. sp. tritici PST-78]
CPSPVMGMFGKRARMDTPTSSPYRAPSQTSTTPQPSTSASAAASRSQTPTQVKAPTPTILSVASMLQENGKRMRSNDDFNGDNIDGAGGTDYSNTYDERVRSPAVTSAATIAAPSSPGASQHSAASNGNVKSTSNSNSNSNDGDGF